MAPNSMKWPVSSRRIRLGKVCDFLKRKLSGLAHFGVLIFLFYYAGGSLGWKVRGSLHGDFEKVAYELEPSTTGNPNYAEVKTGFGYHIIMVEGRK